MGRSGNFQGNGDDEPRRNLSFDLNIFLMFNILAEVTSYVGIKSLVFMVFMDVADVFLCRVDKIQEESIVNKSNVFFLCLLTNVFSEYQKAVNVTLSFGS